MNHDQRKSFRIQVSEGREHASLLVGTQQVDVRVLDESAGGFAVALLADVDIQQNQVHVLKTATGVYETRVARVEHFDDGKLVGLMRLNDLTDSGEKDLKVASLLDYFFLPQKATGQSGGVLAGIAATVVVGVIITIAAVYFIKLSPSRHYSGVPGPLPREFTEAASKEMERGSLAAQEAAAAATRNSSPVRPSSQLVQQQSRFSAEVLFRLQLDADQSRRIRDILSRTAGDMTAAEAEIRSVLTAEQASRWQKLAP